MVFNERHERFWSNAKRWITAFRFLPDIGLSLKKKPVFRSGNKFLGTPAVIGVIGLADAGECNQGGVMPIVIPHPVEIIATFGARPHHFCLLALVFGDQDHGAFSSCSSRGSADRTDDVFLRFVANALDRVESKTVKVIFINPIGTVGYKKFAHWSRTFSVEINTLTPLVLLTRHVIIGEGAKIIPIGAEMVVNNVKNDTQA